MIKRIFRQHYNKIITKYFANVSDLESNSHRFIEETQVFVNHTEKYNIEYMKLPNVNDLVSYRWVGAQFLGDKVFFVPSGESRVLKMGKTLTYLNILDDSKFKWTGSCVWGNAMYCFPRSATYFLKIYSNGITEKLPISSDYCGEHHYGGVCTDGGVVYQPPRNTNHILKTNLLTNEYKKIVLVPSMFRVNFRYCGSIIHPNGYIYFFPENGRVIKLDKESDKWSFIGADVCPMCFDAKVGIDGNIYGYSAYSRGIMKIDVKNDIVKMIHREISPGAYGTKYGSDGCLYSVPGNGRYIYKYNVIMDVVEEIFDLENYSSAKYAGGVTLRNGDIVFAPATADSLLILKASGGNIIPRDVYKKYCLDNY